MKKEILSGNENLEIVSIFVVKRLIFSWIYYIFLICILTFYANTMLKKSYDHTS